MGERRVPSPDAENSPPFRCRLHGGDGGGCGGRVTVSGSVTPVASFKWSVAEAASAKRM